MAELVYHVVNYISAACLLLKLLLLQRVNEMLDGSKCYSLTLA